MRPVFRYALEMAKKHEAKIIMLHVIEPLTSGALVAIDLYMPGIHAKEALKDGMKKTLNKMQQRLNNFCEDEKIDDPEDCEIISKVKVVTGHPGESIVEQAKKMSADLIVLGTHAKPSKSSHLIGSTARNVTQYSTIPVFVVPVHK